MEVPMNATTTPSLQVQRARLAAEEEALLARRPGLALAATRGDPHGRAELARMDDRLGAIHRELDLLQLAEQEARREAKAAAQAAARAREAAEEAALEQALARQKEIGYRVDDALDQLAGAVREYLDASGNPGLDGHDVCTVLSARFASLPGFAPWVPFAGLRGRLGPRRPPQED
jgi:hypothetical protein